MKRNGYTVLKRKSAWVRWMKKQGYCELPEPTEFPCLAELRLDTYGKTFPVYTYPSIVLSMAYALRMKINVKDKA